MSVEPPEDTDRQAEDVASGDDRFAELETGEDVVIYDRQNHRAWLQSDDSVVVTDRR